MKMLRFAPALALAASLLVIPVNASAADAIAAPAPPTDYSIVQYRGIGASASQKAVVKNSVGCEIVRTVSANLGDYNSSSALAEVYVDISTFNRCTKKRSFEWGWAKADSYAFDTRLRSAAGKANVKLFNGRGVFTRTVKVNLTWDGTNGIDRIYSYSSSTDACTGVTYVYADKYVSRNAKVAGSVTSLDTGRQVLDSNATATINKYSSNVSIISGPVALGSATPTAEPTGVKGCIGL